MSHPVDRGTVKVVIARHHRQMTSAHPIGQQHAGVHQIGGGAEGVAPAGFLQGEVLAILQQLHAQLAHHLGKAGREQQLRVKGGRYGATGLMPQHHNQRYI